MDWREKLFCFACACSLYPSSALLQYWLRHRLSCHSSDRTWIWSRGVTADWKKLSRARKEICRDLTTAGWYSRKLILGKPLGAEWHFGHNTGWLLLHLLPKLGSWWSFSFPCGRMSCCVMMLIHWVLFPLPVVTNWGGRMKGNMLCGLTTPGKHGTRTLYCSTVRRDSLRVI